MRLWRLTGSVCRVCGDLGCPSLQAWCWGPWDTLSHFIFPAACSGGPGRGRGHMGSLEKPGQSRTGPRSAHFCAVVSPWGVPTAEMAEHRLLSGWVYAGCPLFLFFFAALFSMLTFTRKGRDARHRVSASITAARAGAPTRGAGSPCRREAQGAVGVEPSQVALRSPCVVTCCVPGKLSLRNRAFLQRLPKATPFCLERGHAA